MLFHRKSWHKQKYTDRVRYYEQISCWRCGCNHGTLRPLTIQPKCATMLK